MRIGSIVRRGKIKGVCFTKGANLNTGVIFQDGSHQFFTVRERQKDLTPVNINLTLASYKYNGVQAIKEDFNQGVFNEAWESSSY